MGPEGRLDWDSNNGLGPTYTRNKCKFSSVNIYGIYGPRARGGQNALQPLLKQPVVVKKTEAFTLSEVVLRPELTQALLLRVNLIVRAK